MKKNKAFTLVEILVVLGMIAILTSIGFGGLLSLRDSIIAQNTAYKIRTIVRDVQNKAITASAFTEDTAGISTWLYGYSLERVGQKYNLYKIVDRQDYIPDNPENTNQIRTQWKTVGCNVNPNFSSFAQCIQINSYSFDSVIEETSTCSLFFTSVNGKITLANADPCRIQIKQNQKLKEVLIDTKGIGNVKICDPKC